MHQIWSALSWSDKGMNHTETAVNQLSKYFWAPYNGAGTYKMAEILDFCETS